MLKSLVGGDLLSAEGKGLNQDVRLPSLASSAVIEPPAPVRTEEAEKFRAFLAQVFPEARGSGALGEPIDQGWLAASGFDLPRLWHSPSGTMEVMSFDDMVNEFLVRPIYVDAHEDSVAKADEDGCIRFYEC